jgi:hypothetical protein
MTRAVSVESNCRKHYLVSFNRMLVARGALFFGFGKADGGPCSVLDEENREFGAVKGGLGMLNWFWGGGIPPPPTWAWVRGRVEETGG